MVYVVPHSSSCLEYSSASPTVSNPNYIITNTYARMTNTQWTNAMIIASQYDAFQTRKPDGRFFHGFSYGIDSTNILPQFPAALGGGTALNLLGAAGNQSINYLFGMPSDSNAYNRVVASNASPGLHNNQENENVIINIRNGTFDYTNCANPSNWNAGSLPLYVHSFSGKRYSERFNEIKWSVTTTEDWSAINLEKSIDGKKIKTIHSCWIEQTQTPISFTYTDATNEALNIYRLHIHSSNGEEKYSKSIVLNNEAFNKDWSIFPNPANDIITISSSQFDDNNTVRIIDLTGNVIVKEYLQAHVKEQQININKLKTGIYYIQLIDESGAIIKTKKFTKL